MCKIRFRISPFILVNVKCSRNKSRSSGGVVFPLVWSHVNTRHIFCSCLRSHFGGGCGSTSCLCHYQLPRKKKHTKKPNAETLDDTPLTMGPPGDRTGHMSTERTEDFSWIVDLSWHGMQQGESQVVTTEEKKRKKTANTSKLQTWKLGGDFV